MSWNDSGNIILRGGDLRLTRQLALQNPFWRFSNHIYTAEGVADECLGLQQQLRLDVNLVLFCAWTGSHGILLGKRELDEVLTLVADWHELVVKPLRQIRESLKSHRIQTEASELLSPAVSDNELKAEQIEQAMLYSWSLKLRPADQQGRDEILSKNLALLLENAEASVVAESVDHLITASTLYADRRSF